MIKAFFKHNAYAYMVFSIDYSIKYPTINRQILCFPNTYHISLIHINVHVVTNSIPNVMVFRSYLILDLLGNLNPAKIGYFNHYSILSLQYYSNCHYVFILWH